MRPWVRALTCTSTKWFACCSLSSHWAYEDIVNATNRVELGTYLFDYKEPSGLFFLRTILFG